MPKHKGNGGNNQHTPGGEHTDMGMSAHEGAYGDDVVTATDDDRWFDLMLKLYEQRSELTRTFLDEVYSVPGYAVSDIPRNDMRKTADEAFDAILRRVIDDSSGPDERLFLAHRLGMLRAQQGVPLQDLITAISLDFKIIWRQLLAISTPEDSSVLARNVERIWNAVDGFSQATQIEYHNECVRLEGSQFADQTLKLGSFISSRDTTEADARAVAQLLSIPAGSRYVVCQGISTPRFPQALRIMKSYSKRIVHYQKDARTWFLFWPQELSDGPGHPRAALVDTPCGYLTGVRSLAAVPRAFRSLSNFMLSIDQEKLSGPLDIRENWAMYAGASLFSTFPELLESLTGLFPGQTAPKAVHTERSGEGSDDTALVYKSERTCAAGEHPGKDDAEYWRTVATFLKRGSVAETAAACFCHRNTVLKRLHRFENMTGLDLRNPEDQTLAVLLAHYRGLMRDV